MMRWIFVLSLYLKPVWFCMCFISVSDDACRRSLLLVCKSKFVHIIFQSWIGQRREKKSEIGEL